MTEQLIQTADEPTDKEFFVFRAWKWWKITWAICRNILYIALILFAFDKASTAFENLVLCLLVLIFQAVNWSHTVQLRLAVEESFATKRLLFLILKRQGEETEDAELAISEVEKKYSKQNSLYYINSVGATVVYLLVAWKVLVTLLG
jgi:hypothetical protein